jgi:glucose/arabinose dehydrogenase
MRRLVLGMSGLVCLTTALAGPLSTAAESADGSTPRANARAIPTLKVTKIVGGLTLPWDAKYTRDGRLLITERSNKRLLTWRLGKLRQVTFPASSVWASGETGRWSSPGTTRARTVASTPVRGARPREADTTSG